MIGPIDKRDVPQERPTAPVAPPPSVGASGQMSTGRTLLQMACACIRAYTANIAGLPLDGELDDPRAIVVSGMVNQIIGPTVLRDRGESPDNLKRYYLCQGKDQLARLSWRPSASPSGWYAFDPSQGYREKPKYGVHATWWDAEAEVIVNLLHKFVGDGFDPTPQGKKANEN